MKNVAWWILCSLTLASCSASSGSSGQYSGVCAMQPIGMTDSGVMAVRVYCEAE